VIEIKSCDSDVDWPTYRENPLASWRNEWGLHLAEELFGWSQDGLPLGVSSVESDLRNTEFS
jgi:hypothetical protein